MADIYKHVHIYHNYYHTLHSCQSFESHPSQSNSHIHWSHNKAVHTSPCLYAVQTLYPQFLGMLHFLHSIVSYILYQPIQHNHYNNKFYKNILQLHKMLEKVQGIISCFCESL